MSIYTPYTYLIGWSAHNKWYYGVRYSKSSNCLYETGCHPNDLWVTYFTSSVEVKRFIEMKGQPDVIEVRKTFDDAKSAQDWEDKVLKRLFAHKYLWLNRRFGGSRFVPTKDSIERNKISKKNRDPEYDLIVRKNISEGSKTGHKNRSEETKRRVSERVKEQNKNRDPSVNRKIASSVSKSWYRLSEKEREIIIEKRKATLSKKRELGIKRKTPTISKISCLCCRKVFDPGNFSKHLKKNQE
jgi:hypothetical protein